jgi:hypothetical protein
MGSESNRGGADRTVGEEETKRGELFEVPEIKFTKLFINGSFVDAVSGTCTVPPAPTRAYLASCFVPLLLVQPLVENGFLLPIHTEWLPIWISDCDCSDT